jgi:UDP-N-acetylmuramoyl-L-alanyl-D-glutamate--2,6-diaminopimelate ligase
MMSIQSLLSGIVAAPADISISDVTLDSREVTPGALFLACRGHDKGNARHGVEFAAQASERGARAVVFETPGADEARAREAAARLLQRVRQRPGEEELFVVAVPDLRAHLGAIADRFFGQPSQALHVIGVTGTNGKTTSAWLIAQALSLCERPAAYIGTLGYGAIGELRAAAHTTADVVSVHRQLASLRAGGAAAVAMEVSSHALDQGRVDEVRFDAAAFTNLTQDHLDYHGSLAAYGAAKALLFARPTLSARVINVDDAFGRDLAAAQGAPGHLIVTARKAAVGAQPHVRAAQVRPRSDGFDLSLETSWGAAQLRIGLLGEFNVDNVLTTLAVLLAAQVPLPRAVAALGQCVAAPGRMQRISAARSRPQPAVIVDYAHTPDALEKALAAARAHCRGRLHLVFGCGGDRDALKRPIMGRIAATGADAITVTDDNPRTEDPAHIVLEILAGIGGGFTPVRVEHDRAAAIRDAIIGAAVDDLVLIAGKGHEDYQIYGTTRREFSDAQVARGVLESRA